MIRPVSAPPAGDPFDAGPFVRAQSKLHLPSPGSPTGARRRPLILAALAWLPLLVLSAIEGSLLGPASFLYAIKAHVHYLVALPLLLVAESWCVPRLALIRWQFVTSGLVAEDDRAALDGLVARARAALDNRGMEVALTFMAYVGAILLTVAVYPHDRVTWMTDGQSFTAAGWWRALVSHPLLLLLIMGWLWRIAVWTRFLAGVARLELRLVPSHPDMAGGLGFLAISLRAFAPVAAAFGAVLSGDAVEALLFAGREPSVAHLASVIGVIVLLFTAPLVVFFGPLRRARLRGMLEYGSLAGEIGRRFEERWLAHDLRIEHGALDVQDFSATTDLYSVVANVWKMRMLPVGLQEITRLIAVTAVPLIPVALLMMPLDAIVSSVLGLLL